MTATIPPPPEGSPYNPPEPQLPVLIPQAQQQVWQPPPPNYSHAYPMPMPQHRGGGFGQWLGRLVLLVAQPIVFVGAVGALYIVLETQAPMHMRPSVMIGNHDARIEETIDAAKTDIEVVAQDWLKEAEIVQAQNIESYRAKTAIIIDYYRASADRQRVLTESMARQQEDLQRRQVATAVGASRSERGIADLANGAAALIDIIDPALGEATREYADTVQGRVHDRVNESATVATSVAVPQWAEELPLPEELLAELDAIEIKPLPPPPDLSGALDRARRESSRRE